MDTLTYSIIDLEGEDALAFANAQFSSDVRTLQPDQWQWSSWLDARGRVRALFLLVATGEQTLRVLLRGGEPAKLIDQLRMFVLRSRVNVQVQPDMYAIDHTSAASMHTVQTVDGDMVLGFGDYAVRLTSQAPDSDARCDWQRMDIEHGFAWLPLAASGIFLSPALSLRRVDATSLSKGCYPGQEIATRLHHRGGNKRHLCRVHASDPITPGCDIYQDETVVGMVLQSVFTGANHVGLAVLHERALAVGSESEGALRVIGDAAVTLHASTCFDD